MIRAAWLCVALALCACATPPPAPLREAQNLERQSRDAPGPQTAVDDLLRAQRLYQAADRGAERGQTEVDLAALYLRHGELDQAGAWASRAATADDVPAGVRAQAQARLAQIALKQGRPEAAAAQLARAGSLCAECVEQGEYLVLDGRILLAQGKAAEALCRAGAAQQARFGDDGGRGPADAQRLAGEASLALNDFGAAREALLMAYAADHAAARTERIWLDLDLLARASQGLNRSEEAADYAHRAALARAASRPAAP